jgi:hypothetical protein
LSKDTVQCRYCKEQVDKSEAKVIGKSTYYHSDCLITKQKEEEKKQKNANEFKDLIAYICELYKLDAPTGMILKQIKEYREEPYNYKLSGIKLSLQYFYETMNNEVPNDVGIGIVPYVYEEAKKHYLMKRKVEKSINEFSGNDTELILIDLHRKRKQTKQLIDISTL